MQLNFVTRNIATTVQGRPTMLAYVLPTQFSPLGTTQVACDITTCSGHSDKLLGCTQGLEDSKNSEARENTFTQLAEFLDT